MSIRTAPFARARAAIAAVAAIIQLHGNNVASRMAALNALTPYRSRGKGRGGYQASKRSVAQDRRAARKARNQLRNRKAHR